MKHILVSSLAFLGPIEAGHSCSQYYRQIGFKLQTYPSTLWKNALNFAYGFKGEPYRESYDTNVLNAITTHGCWCSRFDEANPFKEFTEIGRAHV